ncbi:hypothetical protein GQ57_33575 [Burkholderia sp. MSh2]|uniref:hypothetical protein n=1 Tax=Burkholderia TaxID=32008 RepID=UPI0004D75852|nr:MULTISPECIES: hypothetical protein [Burkholderia]KEZ01757.1 hypothetical protein GQ57_33575 [Burkholderia sp. MSh2]KFG93323.1 hypothetical protein GQ56_0132135 [Burkholderia paludis]
MGNERRYYDAAEQGPTCETSHPRFVSLASEYFYYSVIDDFSPFGSDDGHDTLRALEAWYRGVEDDQSITEFLTDHLAGWGLDVPWEKTRDDLEMRRQWLDKDDMHEVYFQSDCRAIVATAFGQLKIVGQINIELLGRAKTAILDQLWMNKRACDKYPNWPYAEQQKERFEHMLSALNKAVVE